MNTIIKNTILSAGIATALAAMPALAQKPSGLPGNYPNKPVRVIIGASPGGGTDILARMIFTGVNKLWDHPMVMENRVSVQGSALALDYVAKSPPDGYLLNVVSGSTYIGAAIVHKIPKDPLKELDAVAQFNEQGFLMVATKGLPANTVPELIAFAKKNPGKLNYASSGLGGSAFMAAEYLKLVAGKLNIQHIPYKGIGPAYVDLIAGRTDFSFGTTVSALGHVQKGSLKALAITTPQRLPSLPDIPALAETLPGFQYVSFFGVVGPAGMPKPVIAALNSAVNVVLREPGVKQKLESTGATVTPRTPEAFQAVLEDFVKRNVTLVRDANLDLSSAAAG